MYIRDPDEISGLRIDYIKIQILQDLNLKQKQHILHKLNQAVAFENFLHKKFVGQKDFHWKVQNH